MAAARGIPMYLTFSESHARDVPYGVAARLLRSVFGIRDTAPDAARARRHIADADPEDLRLLDDLLGIGDPQVERPTRNLLQPAPVLPEARAIDGEVRRISCNRTPSVTSTVPAIARTQITTSACSA